MQEFQPPTTCLPKWDIADLPEPEKLGWRHWKRFLGPGIVMMGIQIGGGEWMLGPDITARYGGGLMWIATVAIVLQVFYNIECGRYALYTGEPVTTGFLRTRPGPGFWVSVLLLLSLSSLIPGLSTNGAAILAGIILDRPPTEADRGLVLFLAYACLLLVAAPVLVGGKVYNMLQAVMTLKVAIVLGFCLLVGFTFVRFEHWWSVVSGFVQFGNVPIVTPNGEGLVNVFSLGWSREAWSVVSLGNIAVLGAFAGYAGGGGLANSTYSNYVRDKGWGMGQHVGAIASAIGGRNISLSHLGKVFVPTPENMRRWRGWWRYILTDQVLVWAPGCFMGMALPALLSLEFAPYSPLTAKKDELEWAQAIVTADGFRHYPAFSPGMAQFFWLLAMFVGLWVLLPSQMAIIEDFSRRWTDVIWSANARVRNRMGDHQVKYIYYSLLGFYVFWSLVVSWTLSHTGTPKLMTLIIANLNNLSIGVTSFQILWINLRYLPAELRPRWYHSAGMIACGVFYLGLAALVFRVKQWPVLAEFLHL